MVRKLLGYEYGIISTELAIIHYNRCKKNIRNVLIRLFVWCWYCSNVRLYYYTGLPCDKVAWKLNSKLAVGYGENVAVFPTTPEAESE